MIPIPLSASTEYTTGVTATAVGVPVITPVTVLKDKPAVNAGVIANVVGLYKHP